MDFMLLDNRSRELILFGCCVYQSKMHDLADFLICMKTSKKGQFLVLLAVFEFS